MSNSIGVECAYGQGRRRWGSAASHADCHRLLRLESKSSRGRRHRRTVAASVVAALTGMVLLKSNLSGVRQQSRAAISTANRKEVLRNGHGPYLGRRRRRLHVDSSRRRKDADMPASSRVLSPQPRKRLALVRPYAPFSADEIMDSFNTWDTNWPCTSRDDDGDNNSDEPEYEYEYEYDVDLILSYSQTYDSAPADSPAIEAMMSLQKKFDRNGGWNGCFSSLHHIEAAIPSFLDLYERNHVQLNRHWVNGPNAQFRSIMEFVQRRNQEEMSKGMEPYYESVLLLEGDSRVHSVGWLDRVLDEMKTKAPFAILGSKYKGHSWDNFKDQMPKALVEHINGNAVYNITHPLTEHYVGELKDEELTYFNAIPYDYRISQMISEGRYVGYTPEFPFPEMRDESSKFSVTLPSKKHQFQNWWSQWGGDGDANPIKESSVIHNWAATNYLPDHIDAGAPIVHGKGAWVPWDRRKHDITLVVSDWTEDFARSLLSTLDSSDHPFSSVLVMREPNASPSQKSMFERLWNMFFPSISTKIPIRYVERHSPAFMDVCDAPVSSSWFVITNSYHRVADDVDLMFSHDSPPKPLIPFVPASSRHCTDYAACREVYSLAQEIHAGFDMVVLDMDMVYHTSSRNAFCDAWKKTNGGEGDILFNRIGLTKAAAFIQQSIPRGPTASAYLAYLQSSNMADSIYAFTNRLDHGAKDAFVKVHPDIERERHLALTGGRGTEYLYHTAFDEYIMQQGNAVLVDHELVRRVLQAEEQGRPVGQMVEDMQLEDNIFDWIGNLFKRLFLILEDDEEDEKAEKGASASSTEEQEQEEGLGQVNRAGGTPSFSSRTRGGGDDGGKCAAEGSMAKSCGTSGKGVAKDCCTTPAGTATTGLICDPNGSGVCVANVGSYGGGGVARGLIMESPGWLVQKDYSQVAAQAVDRAANARKKVRGAFLASTTSFLGGLLNALGL